MKGQPRLSFFVPAGLYVDSLLVKIVRKTCEIAANSLHFFHFVNHNFRFESYDSGIV